jgi:hypothetical protein
MSVRGSRRSLLFAAAATLVVASGCYRVTVVDGARAPTHERTLERERWAHFFFFGLVGNEQFDVRRICGGPAAKIRTDGDVLTTVTALLTVGLYTPRHVAIDCAAGASRKDAIAAPAGRGGVR